MLFFHYIKYQKLNRLNILVYSVLWATIIFPLQVKSEIIFHNSENTLQQKTIDNKTTYIIKAKHGCSIGVNLFHTFETFNLENSEIAEFKTLYGTKNIINRIVGKQQSNLNGKISAKASVYFLNPYGIFVGKDFSMDINGSLFISTCDYISGVDKTTPYYTNLDQDSLLFSDHPKTFGFLETNIKPIQLEDCNITLKEGNNIVLIAGDISINNTDIHTDTDIYTDINNDGKLKSGDFHIYSPASKGELHFDESKQSLQFSNLGNVKIKNSAIDVSGAPSGNVIIKAGNFYFENKSYIRSEMLEDKVDMPDTPGSIKIYASDSFEATNSSLITKAHDDALNAGNIELNAKNIFFFNNSKIETPSYGKGAGGDVKLTSTQSIIFSDDSQILTLGLSDNDSGNISLNGNNISFINGSGTGSGNTNGKGKAGNLSIYAKETFQMYGQNKQGESCTFHANSYSDDNAGDITIKSGKITLDDGASIYAHAKGKGNAGNIFIQSESSIKLYQNSEIKTESDISGGGIISIKTNDLLFLNKSTISSSVKNGINNGGNITIAPRLLVLNDSQITAKAYEGNGGNIQILANHFIQSPDSIIDATSVAGLDGIIEIKSPANEKDYNIYALPDTFLDASKWEKTPCSERTDSDISRLITSPQKDGYPTYMEELFYLLPVSMDTLNDKDRTFFEKGKFDQMIISVQQTLEQWNDTKDNTYIQKIVWLVYLYQATGQHKKAMTLLENEKTWIDSNHSDYQKALFYCSLGDLELSMGKNNAQKNLKDAHNFAKKCQNNFLLSAILNNLANAKAVNKNFSKAEELYKRSLKIIEDMPFNPYRESIILSNIIRYKSIWNIDLTVDAINDLNYLKKSIYVQQNNYNKAFALISFGHLFTDVCKKLNQYINENILYSLVLSSLKEAQHISEDIQNNFLLSYIYGYSGKLYENKQKYSEAIQMTRKAIFHGQQGEYSEFQYLWKWQLGRLFKKVNKNSEAIKVYKEAVTILNSIKHVYYSGLRIKHDNFNEKIKPVFLEWIDLTLRSNGSQKISKAINIMEDLKVAEFKNYFKDECFQLHNKNTLKMTEVPKNTAYLYPISLNNRLSIILSTHNNPLQEFVVQISSSEIQKEVKHLSNQIKKWTKNQLTYRFIRSASKLYNYIIKPLENELQESDVHTLIIVSESSFCSIPYAILYDGNNFLIHKYAIAVIPSTQLTEVDSSIDSENKPTLVCGLSKNLPFVKNETQYIQKIMNGKLLIDENFSKTNFLSEITQNKYFYIHLATHSFLGQSPFDNHLLLNAGEKITLDELKGLFKKNINKRHSVNLLVLSACETAIGDERAALGLAGAVIQANVKSVIATLWPVIDDDSATFMKQFYTELQNNKSKAEALSNTQKYMIANGYDHPMYWAGYLLVGDWK